MAQARPLPPDLWTRLARLERCCEVSLSSYQTPGSTLRWRMKITRRDGSAPPIIADSETAREAILAALMLAERQEWIPE